MVSCVSRPYWCHGRAESWYRVCHGLTGAMAEQSWYRVCHRLTDAMDVAQGGSLHGVDGLLEVAARLKAAGRGVLDQRALGREVVVHWAPARYTHTCC